MKLNKHLVDKPWGRTDIPPEFGDMGGRRIGEIWYEGEQSDDLPILVKWLFTSEKLSIQVHPNDAQARQRGMISGKEECWFIVDAEPNAVLGMGTTRPLNSDELRAASLSGDIEQLMDWKPVKAGDYFYIPAGTVHAIGAGITLVEIQQNADITYRLYDYGRPRPLHLEDGVEVSVAVPYCDKRSGNVESGLCISDSPFFKMQFVTSVDGLPEMPRGNWLWVVPLKGEVTSNGVSGVVGDCLLLESGCFMEFADGTECLVATQ
ncbi:type I phosphomannose isomerase catalytic subunit [Sphingorhabdus profundilacus]|jgi:mannose-6-phosphate isomerase|uniref:type I phosphomannose isomerase catalytic subunit n=1 Tax=Sphingorhabdus profundilacus TaxID=2509718 RepID=UPI0015D46043|nr:type I phosphomannose isomerase catalytic subunit [Sphingorhabdus profundilacus]